MQMVEGEVEITSSGMEAWLQQWEKNYHYDDSYISNGCIDSLAVIGGAITVTNCDGTTSTISTNYDGGLLVQDTNGNQWIVNNNGTVTSVQGGGLLPNSNDTLSTDEMNILKMAMAEIKNQYDNAEITSLTTTYNSKKTNIENHITQQRQNYPSSADTDHDNGLIGYAPLTTIPNDAGTTKNIDYKNAEIDLNIAKVLFEFSRANNTDEELNFIGKYLNVGTKPYKDYVAEQLAANRTQASIAHDVAQSGIVQLVKNVVRKKMVRD